MYCIFMFFKQSTSKYILKNVLYLKSQDGPHFWGFTDYIPECTYQEVNHEIGPINVTYFFALKIKCSFTNIFFQ